MPYPEGTVFKDSYVARVAYTQYRRIKEETKTSNMNTETKQPEVKTALYRWVKASERLPEKMKQVNGRILHRKYGWRPAIVCNSDLVKDFITANGGLEPINFVEWLEELPLSEKELRETVAVEAIQYLDDKGRYRSEDEYDSFIAGANFILSKLFPTK